MPRGVDSIHVAWATRSPAPGASPTLPTLTTRTPADHAIEGDVARAADDYVGGVVAEERVDLLVAHVVRQRLAGIGRGAVDEQELASVFEGDARVGRQPADALQDELSQGVAGHAHALDALALVIAPGMENRRDRASRRRGRSGPAP